MPFLKYLITNKDDFESLIDYIEHEEVFAVDVETNGKFSQFDASLVGISFGFDLFGCYIPLTHIEGKQLDLDYVLTKLKPILEDEKKEYVFHNAKFDEKIFKIYGIDCKGIANDTYVLSWLVDENGKHGLKYLVEKYVGCKMETYEDVLAKQPRKRSVSRDYNFAKVNFKDALEYASADGYFTLQLFRLLRKRAHIEKLWDAYVNIERPLLRVTRDMEWWGINVDRDYLHRASVALPELVEEIESTVYEAAGEVFNIDSGIQLGRVLYETLGIGKNVKKTASGRWATDKKTLQVYAAKHKIVEDILRRKKIKKTYDTFVKGLYPHIDKDNRVHPSFNSCGTTTGRFSGNSPNMQQLTVDEVEDVKVRDFFIPTEGYVFVVGDFGQIELRLMAHFARDEVATAAFNSGRDFHSETARGMYNLDPSVEPTAKQRFFAKGLNFGVPYGRGALSVAETLGLEKMNCRSNCGKCGQCYIDKWFEAFPRVLPYKKALIKETRQRGYLRTLAGRKRRLPHISSPDNKLRYGAERQAFNTKHQGSAADIIKLAMVEVEPKLRALDAHTLITVHDELVVEVRPENAEKTVAVLKETMEHPLKGENPLRLPLKFEPKIVRRWSEAK